MPLALLVPTLIVPLVPREPVSPALPILAALRVVVVDAVAFVMVTPPERLLFVLFRVTVPDGDVPTTRLKSEPPFSTIWPLRMRLLLL